MTKNFKLPRSVVRKIAGGLPQTISKIEEIRTNDAELLLYLIQKGSDACRIHIYLQTGTVAVIRVLHGVFRHIFHRNCSEKKLRRIFIEPTFLSNVNPHEMSSEIDLLDVGATILAAECNCLLSHYNELTHVSSSPDENEGRESVCNLPQHLMVQVESFVHSRGDYDTLLCAAICDEFALIASDNGKCYRTKGTPKSISSILDSNDFGDRVKFISLGFKKQYFISFENGNYYHHGPKSLDKCFHHENVKTLAFGKEFNDYFIVYENGSWVYDGEIPQDLVDLLRDRQHAADLVCVYLGPNDEYFCKARNGRMWWGGVSDELNGIIDDLVNENEKEIIHISFCKNNGYFIIYE